MKKNRKNSYAAKMRKKLGIKDDWEQNTPTPLDWIGDIKITKVGLLGSGISSEDFRGAIKRTGDAGGVLTKEIWEEFEKKLKGEV